MRFTKQGMTHDTVMQAIARNFERLKQICGYRTFGCYCSQSYEDMFQDTVLVVSMDERAVAMTDAELMDFFAYRFKRTEYQMINDNKMLKEIPYANYLKSKQETDLDEG